jgi:hypothetical protein
MNDLIVEPIRRIREELIKRHGGIDGYFRYCQAQERARTIQPKPRHRKQGARTVRTTAKVTKLP